MVGDSVRDFGICGKKWRVKSESERWSGEVRGLEAGGLEAAGVTVL